MSDLERFNELVDEIYEMILGTKRRPNKTKNDEIGSELLEVGMMDTPPKRARTKGRYKADDKSTKEINEAWVGGKAPNRVKTVGYKKRKKNVKS